ncbi:ImmA/IrrE family metallo-endopeptidase [Cellulophaga sp. E6(2014)]|jgi:Zn-dependent peptidase ImmA (M78 family)/transcriptional regulator with XRE-family HTH domain|uniref:helix-turn-helix domain-containing protein n=1 Tax=Cellulophaga sp. E6(2014) TaxID=1495334 RepID=UPI00051D60B0|nr:XRE family transcriptional regulator [Cellulophaga sp. E6(2014)]KGK29580.1 DNA-binding protein [Cellulophaga sp. E6(2014)]
MKINYRQITFAREYRGYSQSELASKISGLSQPNLSKYEKGFNSLSDELVLNIISFLEFPVTWLYENISNIPENAHYRKRATLSKKDKKAIEYGNRIVGYIVDQMSDSIDWPEFKHVPMDIQEGHTPKSIARYARKVLGLNNGVAVADIFTLLENKGIVVIEVNVHQKFDGVSFITDGGIPIIIINKNFNNDRKRRTLAHEYGHILMHCYFPIPEYRTEKIREEEVEVFTSEFLMPEDYIRGMVSKLKLGDLVELKRYWLTSMSSIVRRAKDLGYFGKDRYTYFNIELSRGGRSDDSVEVYIDEPNLFKEAYKLHKEDLGYSDEDIANAFNIPNDVVVNYLNPPSLRLIHSLKKH